MSWKVPNDPGKFVLGHPNGWPEDPLSIDSVNSSTYLTKAYSMHEWCWMSMNRILDVGLIEKNFDLFYPGPKETKQRK